jgi:hypothetical protein
LAEKEKNKTASPSKQNNKKLLKQKMWSPEQKGAPPVPAPSSRA